MNKQTLIERIVEMVREKRIEGISDVRDESDRDGMRMVIELKRDASADVVLNQLWRFTAMQSSFGVNMLALNHGRPIQMGLRQLLEAFLEFREEVVVRRIKFELAKARDRGHVLVGLAVSAGRCPKRLSRRSRKSPDACLEEVGKPSRQQANVDEDAVDATAASGSGEGCGETGRAEVIGAAQFGQDDRSELSAGSWDSI